MVFLWRVEKILGWRKKFKWSHSFTVQASKVFLLAKQLYEHHPTLSFDKRGLNSLDFSYRLERGMRRHTEYSVSSPSASLVVVLMVRPRAWASNTTSLASGLGTSHRVWFKQKKHPDFKAPLFRILSVIWSLLLDCFFKLQAKSNKKKRILNQAIPPTPTRDFKRRKMLTRVALDSSILLR
jgi:hypothetical protein